MPDILTCLQNRISTQNSSFEKDRSPTVQVKILRAFPWSQLSRRESIQTCKCSMNAARLLTRSVHKPSSTFSGLITLKDHAMHKNMFKNTKRITCIQSIICWSDSYIYKRSSQQHYEVNMTMSVVITLWELLTKCHPPPSWWIAVTCCHDFISTQSWV